MRAVNAADTVIRCAWRLPPGLLPGPGFSGPATEACDGARQKLALERMQVAGAIWDIRVVSCESDEAWQACTLLVEARSADHCVTARLVIDSKRMGDSDWVSACTRHALDASCHGEPTRAFDFTR